MNRKDRIKRELEATTPMYRGVMVKAYEGKASPRAAIKAKCLECCSYERETIKSCTCFSCPLWLYRPYQSETESPLSEAE